ncbi:MAG TPA: ABC transporter permease, partial [Gammaproteobacteria bacterium]|nr:ABC transporter permease [Gammaproteobacteria bacterium]
MFGHYLAIALRNVRRSPVAFAVNAVTLSLGLVCFVTAYAFVAFWDRADRHFAGIDNTYLLTMRSVYRDSPFKFTPEFGPRVPEEAAAYLREDFPGIDLARAIIIDRKAMIASDTQSARLFGLAVDPEFLELFPLSFAAGSSATALTSPGSVVLTRATASRLFGDASPLGKHVILANAVEASVTGVIDPVTEPSHLGHTTNATLPFDFLATIDVRDAVRVASTDPRTLQYILGRWNSSDAYIYLRLGDGGLSARSLGAQLADFAARHVPAEDLKRTTYDFGLMRVDALLDQRNFQRTGLSFGTVLFTLASLVLGVACL